MFSLLNDAIWIFFLMFLNTYIILIFYSSTNNSDFLLKYKMSVQKYTSMYQLCCKQNKWSNNYSHYYCLNWFIKLIICEVNYIFIFTIISQQVSRKVNKTIMNYVIQISTIDRIFFYTYNIILCRELINIINNIKLQKLLKTLGNLFKTYNFRWLFWKSNHFYVLP